MQDNTAAIRPAASTAASSRTLAAAFCLGFGVFLLWGVGFAQSSVLHNAAHDTRHTNGFPCH